VDIESPDIGLFSWTLFTFGEIGYFYRRVF